MHWAMMQLGMMQLGMMQMGMMHLELMHLEMMMGLWNARQLFDCWYTVLMLTFIRITPRAAMVCVSSNF